MYNHTPSSNLSLPLPAQDLKAQLLACLEQMDAAGAGSAEAAPAAGGETKGSASPRVAGGISSGAPLPGLQVGGAVGCDRSS